jgi:hypothetical protein
VPRTERLKSQEQEVPETNKGAMKYFLTTCYLMKMYLHQAKKKTSKQDDETDP